MQRVVDREQLELIATGLCLLSRNPSVKQPKIIVSDHTNRLIIEFENGFISVEIWEDDEDYFLAIPNIGMQIMSRKAFSASIN